MSIGTARQITKEKESPWLRDQHGRWVLFRGVNLGALSKLDPYLPIRGAVDGKKTQEALSLLQRAGCNVVRLIVIWAKLEPEPRSAGAKLGEGACVYLETLNSIIEDLYRRDIFVFLDFHQDIVNERYGGEGFPPWAIAGGASKAKSRPPDAGWSTRYYLCSGVRESLTAFWRNRDGIQAHMVETMGLVAEFFRKKGTLTKAILGFEPFNEPHEGSVPAAEFEVQLLPRFYRHALEAIGEDGGLLFVEPRVDWTTYGLVDQRWPLPCFTTRPQTRLNTDRIPAERLVLSVHYYDPWTIMNGGQSPIRTWGKRISPLGAYVAAKRARSQAAWRRTFEHIKAAAVDRNAVPFLTEFGLDRTVDGCADLMNLQFAEVDRLLLNSTYWNFDLYNNVENGDGWNHENFSLLGPAQDSELLNVFARPYARRCSAEPSAMSYDPQTRHFSLTLAGEPITSEPTLVFVPHEIHFQEGFDIFTSGEKAVWDAATSTLEWKAAKGERHWLEIWPRGRAPDSLSSEPMTKVGG